MDIEAKVNSLPASPGVYIMKGKEGIIYIGKAKNLRVRVRSYFHGKGDARHTVRFLAKKVEDIDCIVTGNEIEALILEDTLLKKHKPRYNIRLKDDKTYVSIKVTTKEKFPRILVTRRVVKDGSRYFGPYASARAVRDTVKFIRRIFPLCVCSPSEFRNRVRPCLDHQMGICAAPAVGLITEGDYCELVDGAVMFLEGRNRHLVKDLKKKMQEASAASDFERAAELRDRVAAIEGLLEEQKVLVPSTRDQDVFALAKLDGSIIIEALFIREGRLTGASAYPFHHVLLEDAEVLSSFISQFYRGERYVPDEVLTNFPVEGARVLSEWLSDRRGRRVALSTPKRGHKVKLVEMALENAREELTRRKGRDSDGEKLTGELQKRLRLKTPPRVIEAFDISNIGGDDAVGAMVTFRDAKPVKDRYRRYRIRSVMGPDDYAMMYEVLLRRYGKLEVPLPDLILVDGGKGQLNIARKALGELNIKAVALAALAKERPRGGRGGDGSKGERVYLVNVKDPLLLKEGSGADLLLRRIRDEVHRFAVAYHRKLRGKLRGKLKGKLKGRGVGSALDHIPGIGVKRRALLFERFGDLGGIRGASVEELQEVPGITPGLARAIKQGLSESRPGET